MPCYRLTDDLLHVHHHVPTSHVRPVPDNEISPLSVDVPPEEKHIHISIENQYLFAYEGDRLVYEAQISSGVPTKDPQPNQLPTDTPIGRFRVQTKMPTRHMGDGEINSDVEAYELPGVPWVCLFTKDGVALHGTYWHDNFGRKMSHGCVNLRNQDALWLYRWTTPVIKPGEWYARDLGTRIDIYEH
jgi:lipoprotein-anchoring transpeptidase ErfK/SrfK